MGFSEQILVSMYYFRTFLAHLLLKLAELIRPKAYTKEIEFQQAKQKNLRAERLAQLKDK